MTPYIQEMINDVSRKLATSIFALTTTEAAGSSGTLMMNDVAAFKGA
jgi:hypothetical protein